MTLSAATEVRLDQTVDQETPALVDLARKIHAHPELRFQEEKAAAWIAELLSARGFEVERGVGGLSTALRARSGKKGGGRVAILGEYDALPEIGHACGHNLIAASAVGAFLAAAEAADDLDGEVVFLGTPAEEGGGGKIKMIDAGLFDGLDAAMMFHPFDRDVLAHPSLAMCVMRFAFHGAPAHGALAPHDGKSALTACLDTFRLIDGQRVHLRDGVRVHGIVTNGGQAINVIPESAACEFSVRAPTFEELSRVQRVVERCGRAAAMASDVGVDVEIVKGYRDMRNNMELARAFGGHLRTLGREARETDGRVGAGSTDMGDVSHVVPSIHPYLAIVDEHEALCHQHAFAGAAASDRGLQTAILAAKALARTACELLGDRGLRERVRHEWSKGQA